MKTLARRLYLHPRGLDDEIRRARAYLFIIEKDTGMALFFRLKLDELLAIKSRIEGRSYLEVNLN